MAGPTGRCRSIQWLQRDSSHNASVTTARAAVFGGGGDHGPSSHTITTRPTMDTNAHRQTAFSGPRHPEVDGEGACKQRALYHNRARDRVP